MEPGHLKRIRNKLTLHGLEALDKRSTVSQRIKRWRSALQRDLGGPSGLTVATATLVDLAARSKLLLDHIDGYLLQQSSLIRKKEKRVLPIVIERAKLADSLTRQLTTLGLERKATVIPALASYVADKYPGTELAGPGPAGA